MFASRASINDTTIRRQVLHVLRTYLTGDTSCTSCTVIAIEPSLSAVSTVVASYHTLTFCQPLALSRFSPTVPCEQIFETPLVTFHTEKLHTPQQATQRVRTFLRHASVCQASALVSAVSADSVYPDTTNEFESGLNSIPPIASTYGSCCVCRLEQQNKQQCGQFIV